MRLTRTMMLEVLRQGLYQDGMVKRAQGEGSRLETCLEECTDPVGHTGRKPGSICVWGYGHHRANIPAAWSW